MRPPHATYPRLLAAAAVVASLSLAWLPGAQAEEKVRVERRRPPHAGYVFPAGGQAGTTVEVKLGGQYLRQVTAVYVTGEGVHVKPGIWYPPPRPLDGNQRRDLMRLLLEARNKKLGLPPPPVGRENRPRDGAGKGKVQAKGEAKAGEDAKKKAGEDAKKNAANRLENHPMLKDLESKSLLELAEIARYFLVRRNPLQRKISIEETVKLEITIDPDAEPGLRELRLQTRSGMTNPLRFRVSRQPEVVEKELVRLGADGRGRPNRALEALVGEALSTPTADLPVVFNGQILPQDVDEFTFRAKKGQRLLVRTEARALVPFQADSVPGWMQATVAIFDASGQELAYADEYRFDPDPVLFFEVPADGEYRLEVRDAVSRGRDDFVYRVTVGELPFVTSMFPLGCREGGYEDVTVEGWNLPWRTVPIDTRMGGTGPRRAVWHDGDMVTNELEYDVDSLPETAESEPNDSVEEAPQLELPRIVNGRIGQPDDVDVYAFEGRAGMEIVAEVRARGLGSPLDSLLRLVDAQGNVLAWNDDYVPEGLDVRGLGLKTHHADSYLRAKLPKGGTYYVRISDVRAHGSEAHAYRLRISEPRPDVELYVTPSSVNVAAGRAALIEVRAIRKDGYDGDIELSMDGAPAGFELGGGRIRAGQDLAHMTLSAPRQASREPMSLRMAGTLMVDGKALRRPVIPADNVMQAFLWRHLVPAREFNVLVEGSGRWLPVISLDEDEDEEPMRIRRGQTEVARFGVNGRIPVKDLGFAAIDAPKGVTVGVARATPEGFTLEVRVSEEAEATGKVENLIVEAFAERSVPSRQGKKKVEKRRFSLGYLPAIPYCIVK